mmetsp:Transcript_8468/g.17042  ORF Transcript_8468/g.17042 Transcript_8468/m.17042 type:complete len:209 (+) Transcript_8468:56-682(+)
MIQVVAWLMIGVSLHPAASYALDSTLARPLCMKAVRAPSLRMVEVPGSLPSPLDVDVVHVFTVGFGNEGEARLALTQVTSEKGAVLLPLWRFAYEHEAGGGVDQMARAEVELRAELGMAKDASSIMFGAYLNGVDGDEHGIALVRIETDTSPLATGRDRNVMVVDRVLISPAIPIQNRAPLHAALLQSLHALGEASDLRVRLWTEYDA